jgi:5S rRNA maturation endonuclease (ribonuclease M5)
MTSQRFPTNKKNDPHREVSFRHADMLLGLDVLSPDVLRAEKLRELLHELAQVNADVPIVVEGRRDCEALRALGFTGELVTLHGRGGFYEFAEDMHARFDAVILLLDWDEKGELLQAQVAQLLHGLWEGFGRFRESLKNLCQKDVQDVQGVPALLCRLAGTEVVVGGDKPDDGGRA